jgi:hypothetical protein
VWIAGPEAARLPHRYLLPAITEARELFEAGNVLRKSDHLRRVIDLPEDLDELTNLEQEAVRRFLSWAEAQDAHKGYVATHRRAWWRVGCKEPAPILCTYMARRAPHFVRNAANARHINIAHGLYPRERLNVRQLDALATALRVLATVENGRVYAGGLVKFEPRELERILIPPLDSVHEYLTQHTKLSKAMVT